MRLFIAAALLVAFTQAAFADRSTLDPTKTHIAYRMPTAPTIDGIVDQAEWEYAGYHPKSGAKGWFWQVRFDDRTTDDGGLLVEDSIRGGKNGDGSQTPPTDLADLAYAVYVGYDDANLYIGVNVDDNVISQDSAEANSANGTTWMDDSVEVFVDGDNSNFESRDTSGTNPEVVGTGGQFVITVNNAYREAEAGNPGYGATAAWFAKTSLKEDGTGYFAEFRISLSALGNPKFGDIIGFSVAVNDDDDDGPGDKQLITSGSPHTEVGYGNLIIGGKSYTAPKVTTAPTVDGTINPAEYAGAQEIVVDPQTGVYDLREGDDTFEAGDNGFSAWVVHDNTAIYVAILARDEVISTDNAAAGSENGNTWDDDSVEIYLDSDDSNDIGRGSNGFEGQYVYTANGAIRTAEANNPTFGPLADWFAANRTVEGGYSTEFKVMKAGIGSPADGAKIGFHMDMNDDDGNLKGGGATSGRLGQIGWSGRSHSEFTYGVLELARGQGQGSISVQKIAVVGDNVEITIASAGPVEKVALQRSSVIGPAQWTSQEATITAGQGGTIIARFPKPTSSPQFYRAVLNP